MANTRNHRKKSHVNHASKSGTRFGIMLIEKVLPEMLRLVFLIFERLLK